MRPELISRESLDILVGAGCGRIQFGIESGDEELRRSILKRGIPNSRFSEISDLLKSRGIYFLTYNMVGIPGEDPKSALETIKINARIGPDYVQNALFYPLPRTELFEKARKEGLFSNRVVKDYFVDTILDLPGFPRDQVLFFHNSFKRLMSLYRTIWKLPKPIGLVAEKAVDWILLRRTTGKLARLLGLWKRPG